MLGDYLKKKTDHVNSISLGAAMPGDAKPDAFPLYRGYSQPEITIHQL